MLIKDPWLSNYFQRGAYCCHEPHKYESFPEGFTYVKISCMDPELMSQLIRNGFSLIEISVFFEQEKLSALRTHKIEIVDAEREDQNSVIKIAESSFIYSRFHRDKKIGFEKASKIKADWARNYFYGKRGDKMLVARVDRRVVGFMLLLNNQIDLIATSNGMGRMGVASALIAFANQKIGLLAAGTQLINKPALDLYQKNGFRLKSSHAVFHRHSNAKPNTSVS